MSAPAAHGTHVTSLVGGKNTSAAPEANLYFLLWRSGYDTTAAMSELLEWASTHPTEVGVVNLSLGDPASSVNAWCQTMKALFRQGMVPVTGAGNFSGPAADSHPGGCRYNINVGNTIPLIGTNSLDRQNSTSEWGLAIDVWSPGYALGACSEPEPLSPPMPAEFTVDKPGLKGQYKSIASTECNTRYHFMNGTSMASPVTAGVALSYQAHTPQVDPEALRHLVISVGATANAVSTHASEGEGVYEHYLGVDDGPT